MYEHDEISTFEFALEKIAEIQSVLSEKFNPQILIPNEKFDWINQRGNIFETLIPLAPDQKFDIKSKSFFVTNSNGIKTGHDIVSYNFSKKSLEKNIESFIRGKKLKFDKKKIILSSYRPFCEENFYYDFNQRRYQFEKIFPSGEEENFLICVSGVGSKKNFSAFLINKITDLELVSKSQCFPMYWYERAEVEQKSLFDDGKEKYKQCDGVSDFILNQAKSLYGEWATKEDIFYYVYGFLHLLGYREKFSAELKKSLPRIFLVDEPQKFWQIVKAGHDLAEIHLRYEDFEKPECVEVEISEENYFVRKMKLSADKETLQYNDSITIKNIPAKVFEYVVNGRSPVEWIIERYQIKIDKSSGIENNPNDWCEEIGDEKYILKLLLSSMTVALKTLEIVKNLPNVDFE